MMKEGIQRTLGDLYAIRAAMSLVADNDEKSESNRREVAMIYRDINVRETAIKNGQDKGNKMRCDLQEGNHAPQKYVREGISKEQKIAFIVLSALGAVGGALVLILLLPSVLDSSTSTDWADLAIVFFPVTFGLLFIGSCIMVPQIIDNYIWGKRIYKKRTRERETKCQEMLEELEQLQADIKSNERDIVRLRELLPSRKEAIQAIAQQSKEIVESAIKVYPIIDIRDWENVDLLIYYFETGRAEDMKEALQLVDRQRQTDQIVNALRVASESICKSIERSMAQLETTLVKSFSALSSQLARQHNEIMKGLEEGRKATEAQTRAIISTQAMNKALLKNINISSAELAQQMDRQMREVHGIY